MKKIFFLSMFFAFLIAFCNDVKAQEVAGYDSTMQYSAQNFKNAAPNGIVRETHYGFHGIVARWIQRLGLSKISKTEKGVTNGVAPLDGTGKVPAIHVPTHGHVQSDVINLNTDLNAIRDKASADSALTMNNINYEKSERERQDSILAANLLKIWKVDGNNDGFSKYIGLNDDSPLRFRQSIWVAGFISNTLYQNTAFGRNAMGKRGYRTGRFNVAVGDNALSNIVDTTLVASRHNTAIGQGAMFYTNQSSSSTGVGIAAMQQSLNPSGLAALGSETLRYIGGKNNTAIGFNAFATTYATYVASNKLLSYRPSCGIENATATSTDSVSFSLNKTIIRANVGDTIDVFFEKNMSTMCRVVSLTQISIISGRANFLADKIEVAHKHEEINNSTALGSRSIPDYSNQVVLGDEDIKEVKFKTGSNYAHDVVPSLTTADDGKIWRYNSSSKKIEMSNTLPLQKSPNGACWTLTVSDSGVVTAVATTCPN